MPAPDNSNPFPVGVIEGFYGRSWSHETRLAYADLLAGLGLNSYLYCPKNDPFLRRDWRLDWPPGQRTQLEALGLRYREAGLYWGVGLSPMELYLDYGRAQRAALRDRLATLLDLGIDLLAILFDDMPGDLPDLAERQAEILADVRAWAPGVQLSMCPTYYSFDPVLEQHFGAMPDHYWQDLGAALAGDIGVFWTGNAVCSEAIAGADIERINALLGRPVTLWDNYPVNDGAKRSNFLYLEPLPGRSEGLRGLLRGHFCNPMNQAWTSLPALNGLGRLYGGGLTDAALGTALGPEVWRCLRRDAEDVQRLGLAGLGPGRAAALAGEYAALPGECAAEVAGWLRGEYLFDPACLTD